MISLSFLLFIVFTVIFTWIQDPVYKAVAHIRMDQYKPIVDAISDILVWSPGEVMDTEVENIQSPDVLEKVAEKLGKIKKNTPTNSKYGIITEMQKNITIERVGETNMIRISVESSDPKLAATTANLIATVYQEVSYESKTKDVREKREFIFNQLQNAKAQLMRAENAFKEYKERHGALDVDSETSLTIEKLGSFEGDLMTIRREIADYSVQISRLNQKLKSNAFDVETDPELMSSPNVQAIYGKLDQERSLIMKMKESYRENSPEVAARIKVERQLKSTLTETARSRIRQQLEDLTAKKNMLVAKEGELRSMISGEVSTVPQKDMELSRLSREIAVNEELYTLLNREYKEAQIKEKGVFGEIKIVSRAMTPRAPIKPNKKFNIIIGVFMGFLISLALALIVETSDTSFGAIEEVEKLLEVSVLAAVPHFEKVGRMKRRIFPLGKHKYLKNIEIKDHSKILPTIFDPTSAESETYRHLRTNLKFARLDSDKKVFLVSSSGPQEGKSVTACNLAIVLAQGNNKTLLMSCNLRRPTIYKKFGMSKEPGVSDVIIGSCTLDDAVHPYTDITVGGFSKAFADEYVPGIQNLSILTAGTPTPNPAELLESRRMTELIKEIKEKYDVVIIDAPPILPVTDALLLGSKVDGTILVYQLGRLPRIALTRTKRILSGLNIPIIGIVLNDVRPEFHTVTPIYISYEYLSATKKQVRKKT